MTKEQYIIDRETGRVDLNAAYYMYQNKNPEVPKVGIDQFILLFSTWVKNSKPYVDKYFNYYDEMFEIVEQEKGEDV